MQMQDWQGRKTVRSQQMDAGAQSSLGTSPRLPYTVLSAPPPAAPRSPAGHSPSPEALCTGPTPGWGLGEWQQAVVEEMPLDCRRDSQGLTAGELFPPASKNTPILSLWIAHTLGYSLPCRAGVTCLPRPKGHRNSRTWEFQC